MVLIKHLRLINYLIKDFLGCAEKGPSFFFEKREGLEMELWSIRDLI